MLDKFHHEYATFHTQGRASFLPSGARLQLKSLLSNCQITNIVESPTIVAGQDSKVISTACMLRCVR